MNTLKEYITFVLVALLLGLIIAIVLTGGGILSPEYWSLL